MYTYEINAGYSAMDASLRMTVPAILDCFQDAAIFEAENGRITVGISMTGISCGSLVHGRS